MMATSRGRTQVRPKDPKVREAGTQEERRGGSITELYVVMARKQPLRREKQLAGIGRTRPWTRQCWIQRAASKTRQTSSFDGILTHCTRTGWKLQLILKGNAP